VRLIAQKESLTKARGLSSMAGNSGGLPAGRIHNPKPNQKTQMKLKNLFSLLAACAIAVPAFAEEDTPLAKEMDKVSKALKAIGRAAKEGKVTKDMTAKVDEAKTAAQAASKLEPAKTKEVPAAEKAKFLAGYKESMEGMIKGLDDLKTAVGAEKADDVAKIIEKLNEGKKDGHKKYKSED
jgi:soluble cytochrome b562